MLNWTRVLGRRLCVRVQDTGFVLHFSLRAAGFHAEPDGPAEVTLTAGARDLARSQFSFTEGSGPHVRV